MAESKIKDENYFQVSGWMINRLNLKGIHLEIFAIIYGFTQDGENEFTGSVQYLCDFTGTSRPTVINALKKLTEDNLLEKRAEVINGVTFNRYKVNLQGIKNFYSGSKEILLGGSKETLPNNKDSYNNKNNKDKESKQNSFDKIIAAFSTDEKTVELLQEWLKVRKAKRAAMTDRAIQMNIDKLKKLADQSGMTVCEYLSEVICRGWAAFYPIKQYGNNNGKTYGENGIAIDQSKSDLDDLF